MSKKQLTKRAQSPTIQTLGLIRVGILLSLVDLSLNIVFMDFGCSASNPPPCSFISITSFGSALSGSSCAGGSLHPRLTWCKWRASFSVRTHSMLTLSRANSRGESDLRRVDWSGGSGKRCQQLLVMSCSRHSALSKCQSPTLNFNL